DTIAGALRSRPADRRCGVPTHSRDRGPGAARQAARRGEAEPRGSSASCRCRAPPQPPRSSTLKVERASFPTRAFGYSAILLPPAASPSRSGPGGPEGSESDGSCCYFLDPLTPLSADPQPLLCISGAPASAYSRREG
uniref:Uncharacterized protein n=1 Tax=Bos mutus grunniens TaxID=30521 RepID=A0A8C0AIK0_BOSMU